MIFLLKVLLSKTFQKSNLPLKNSDKTTDPCNKILDRKHFNSKTIKFYLSENIWKML